MATDCLYTRTYAEHADRQYCAEHSVFSPNFAALVSEHLIDKTPTCPGDGHERSVGRHQIGLVRCLARALRSLQRR